MMNEEPKNIPTAPTMEPAFKKFFDEALPKNGRSHTLALGELHNTTEHLQWLQQHLPQLQRDCGITTIGVEHSAFLNPLFWAYKDGTLTAQLGGKIQAQNYVRTMLMARTHHSYRENTYMLANLLMSAMDAGMDVVAYDSRVSYTTVYDFWLHTVHNEKKIPENDSQKNRENTDFLKNIITGPNDEAQAWSTLEMAWLRQLKPEYKVKCDASKQLMACGHQKINTGALTSDALSATFFNAMARPTGNRITIGGAGHINGIGYKVAGTNTSDFQQKIYTIHGTFSHHVRTTGQSTETHQPHKVTAAVIATTAVGEIIQSRAESRFCDPTYKSVLGHRVHYLNLDRGEINRLWQPEPDDDQVVSLEQKFPKKPFYDSSSNSQTTDFTQAHINPLLMPDIKAASDALRTAMHGPSNEHAR